VGDRGAGGNLRGQGEGIVHQTFRGHRLQDEAAAFGLDAVERLPGEQEIEGALEAKGARERVRQAAIARDAAVDLHGAEARVGGGEAEVAAEREAEAHAQGVAVDRADDHFVGMAQPDRRPLLRVRPADGRLRLRVGLVGEAAAANRGARAERGAVPVEDERAHRRIEIGGAHVFVQDRIHFVVHRVVPLGAVEREDTDAAFDPEQHGFVCHGFPLRGFCHRDDRAGLGGVGGRRNSAAKRAGAHC
jgi:hypothetical protein